MNSNTKKNKLSRKMIKYPTHHLVPQCIRVVLHLLMEQDRTRQDQTEAEMGQSDSKGWGMMISQKSGRYLWNEGRSSHI